MSNEPKSLEEIIAECAKFAVPEGAWEAEQARMRGTEVRDELESTIPAGLRWAMFVDGTLRATPKGETIATPDAVRRSLAAIRCEHVVWMGAPGRGKSSLAVASLRLWVAKSNRAAMFAKSHHLATARIQNKAGQGDAPYVVRAIVAPLLLIDDLGSGGATANDAAPDVIRDRVDEGRPLWITTGMRRKELAARFDGGALRRVMERAMVIDLGGLDDEDR